MYEFEILTKWYWWVFAAILVSVVSYFAVRLLIHYFKRNGSLDVPNQRSMHTSPTPTGAGLVIAFFMILASSFLLFQQKQPIFIYTTIVLAILAVIGWVDDKKQLSVKLRLVGFFILSLLISFGIGRIIELKFGNSLVWHFPYFIATALTIFYVIWLINLYNFMDGMDGLAAMQTIIAASGFLYIFLNIGLFENNFQQHREITIGFGILSAVVIFSTIGFLLLNWSPAKIFLGDVGSLPIGGFFAISSVFAVFTLEVSIFTCVLMIGIFFFDATYTLIARLLRGEKITQAHRTHLYQRLDSVGVQHHVIVTVYSIVMIVFVGVAITHEWQLISGFLAGLFSVIGVILIRLWVWLLEKKQDSIQ